MNNGNLCFGVNTDSFFGIGFGLIGNNDPRALELKFNRYFELLNKYRIQAVEINTEIEQLSPGFLGKIIAPIIKSSDVKANIKSVSVHLPYLQLNPSSLLEEYRKLSVDYIIRVINACRELEALNISVGRFVLHLTSEFEDSIMFFPIGEEDKKALIVSAINQARKSMSDILKKTGLNPCMFALENLEVFPFDYLYPIVKEYNISICFDIGHWGLSGFMPLEFIEKFKLENISEIHIQDMVLERQGLRITVRKEHRALGDGILRVDEFFHYLKDKKFGGSLIIENRSEKDLIKSIEYLKSKNFI